MHRMIVAIAATLVGVATLAGLHYGLDVAEIASPQIRLDAIKSVRVGRVQLMKVRDRNPNAKRVAFLGDSTAIAYPFPNTVPLRLQAALSHLPSLSDNRVISFGFSGMNVSDYYFVSDLVLAGEPDALVMAFNPASLSQRWRAKLARPQLAGWIPPMQIVEAISLPFHWVHLSLDDLFLYMGIVNVGADRAWMWVLHEQARISKALDAIVSHVNSPIREIDSLVRRRSFIADAEPARETAYRVHERYGEAFAGIDLDHPAFQMLRASLNRYRDAGVPVVVYVVPINFEHFRDLGSFGGAGLATTSENLRLIVEASGASFIDLHDLIPDSGFRDGSGHLTDELPIPGPTWVGDHIAPVLAQRLSRSVGSHD